MSRAFWIRWLRVIDCLVVVFFIAGCAAAPMPIAAPTTTTTEAPSFATVSAIQALVERVRGSNDAVTLKETDPPLPLEADDRVTVDTNGRARLRFQDFLSVELFRNTQLQVGEPRVDLQTTGLIRLKELFGHSSVELQKEVGQRIQLTTDFATIEPTQPGSQVVVCHDPKKLTCVAATSGEVAVTAQGKVVTLEGGEATYILPGQAPEPKICINPELVRQWMDQMRSSGQTQALGALVQSVPQVSCAEATRVAAAPLTAPPAAPTESVAPAGSAASTVSPTVVVSATAAATPALSPAPATPYGPAPTSAPRGAPAPAFIEGMVRIKGGAYTVGLNPQPPDAYHVAPRQVTLASFWIDEHEATNAHYQDFVKATGHAAPATWAGGQYAQGRDDYPVAGLTFADAQAYCAWAGKRLPTEAEWEVAGRGGGAQPLMYPWGNEQTASGQVYQLPEDDTYPVGSVAFNRSPSGVYDMAGNVWEWVDKPYAPLADGQQMLRGGRYGLIRDMAYRQSAAPDDQRFVPFAGVRCAADDAGG